MGAFLEDLGAILRGLLGGFWVGLELIMGRRLAAGKRAKNIACQYCLQRPYAVELASQPVALKCFRIGDLGFRLWGLGFRTWGVGFGAWGLGFGV